MALTTYESGTISNFTGQNVFETLRDCGIPWTSSSIWSNSTGYLRWRNGLDGIVVWVKHQNTGNVRIAVGSGQYPSLEAADDEISYINWACPQETMAYQGTQIKICAAWDGDRIAFMFSQNFGALAHSNDMVMSALLSKAKDSNGTTNNHFVGGHAEWFYDNKTPSLTAPPYEPRYWGVTASDVEYNTSKFSERLEDRVYIKTPLLQLGDVCGYTNILARKAWQINMDDTDECKYAGYVTLNGKQYYRLGAFILEE